MTERDGTADPAGGVPDDLAAALPEALGPHVEAALAEASSWVEPGRGGGGPRQDRRRRPLPGRLHQWWPRRPPRGGGRAPVRIEASGPFQAYGDASSGPPPASPVAPQPSMPPPGAGS
ncbi:MAG: hypothetical protein R2731_14405 [Nocardioides sp.]